MTKIIIALATLILFSSCSSVRIKKTEQSINSISLSSSNKRNVLRSLHEPMIVASVRGDKTLKELYYWPRIGNCRNLYIEFHNNRVTGFRYTENAPQKKLLEDISNADRIQTGSSKKSDVLSLLGEPTGKTLKSATLIFRNGRNFSHQSKCSESWIFRKQAITKTRNFPSRFRRRRRREFFLVTCFTDAGIVHEVTVRKSR